MKAGPGRPVHLRLHGGKRNPPGSKIARRFAKHTGAEWKGEVVHGGALTELNRARAMKRLPMSMKVST